MKRLILFIPFIGFLYIANAQTPGIFLKNEGLKGKVKKATTILFSRMKDQADTLNQPDKRVLEFDQNGNILKETYRGAGSRFSYKINYLYTANNTIIGEKFDLEGSLVGKVTYTYDKKGFEIAIDREGLIFGPPHSLFKNNDEGNAIELDDYIGDDNVINSITLMKYNEKGERSSQTTYRTSGRILGSESFTYDSLKNLIRHDNYFPNGDLERKLIITDSNPDKNGNWQLRTIAMSAHTHDYQFELSYFVIKRAIEYYDIK